MNPSLRQDLTRDSLCDAARRRRRSRQALLSVNSLLLLALAAVLWNPSPPTVAYQPPPAFTPTPFVPSGATPGFTKIDSEEELLAELEDLGPILVTAADGSRWLYLTAQEF